MASLLSSIKQIYFTTGKLITLLYIGRILLTEFEIFVKTSCALSAIAAEVS